MSQPYHTTQQSTKKTFTTVLKVLTKNHNTMLLKTQLHSEYLLNSLHKIGGSIFGYDVGHPWLLYYITNGLNLMRQEERLTEEDRGNIVRMLNYCKAEGGGFAGGHGQYAHLAPTYAAFLAVLSLGPQAYHLLDRQSLYFFFKKLKDGRKFHMHQHGQCDLRGIYIVVIIGKLLNMNPDIYQGLADEIISCQTYEGGLTNSQGGEAHGGYTFCGVAALAVLQQLQRLDVSRLMYWMSQRQVEVLGGFNGRTNKLIDSCYSFWVGAVFNIVNDYFKGQVTFDNRLLYNQQGLQRYLIQACQEPKGGLVDKPDKNRDLYHTAYALSGLSLSQFDEVVFKGIEDNELRQQDPVYNVTSEKMEQARKYFEGIGK